MRSILSTSWLLLSLLLATCDHPQSEQNESGKTDTTTQPQQLRAAQEESLAVGFDQQDYHLPDELKYVKQKFEHLYHKFRPIGWSEAGYFAYVEEPADEACGCYFFELRIINPQTGEELYTFEHTDEGKTENAASMWDKNYETFRATLNKFGILQAKTLRLESRKVLFGEKKMELKLRTQKQLDADFQIELVRQIEIDLTVDAQKSTVYQSSPESMDALINVTLPGVLKDADNKHLTALLQEERRGYEGPPHVLKFKLIAIPLSQETK